VLYIVLEVCLYLGGSVILLTRFPERCFPAASTFGQALLASCQPHALQLSIVCGALVHCFGLVKVEQSRLARACPARF